MHSLLIILLLLLSPNINAEPETAGAVAYPPIGVDMPLRQVSEHVYYVEGLSLIHI